MAAAAVIYAAEGDIDGYFSKALFIVASSTTPRRGGLVARWTPFDPKAIRRDARRRSCGGRP
jgi:hypothetical protein